jgi:hypothetical protein
VSHEAIQAPSSSLLLALIQENFEFVAAVAVFAVWKGPGWGLEVLALEKAWVERRERKRKEKKSE